MEILEIKPWIFLTTSSLSFLGGILLTLLIRKSMNFQTLNLEQIRRGFLVGAMVFTLVGAFFGLMTIVALLEKNALMLIIEATLGGFCFLLGIGFLLFAKIISNKEV
jgi:hypothetical protein